ncbi:lysophospholipid acyltransferase family protein [Microbacterium limosum]|uniref:Lysophospholipid acyltransferase family protein n=1 Tax=Microbacterium limosum TaxID=3079935 RepID=A0AAU0MJP7_9MICO|nr:lysophospholipid acyltransferase family protein [Microbacterium sp. Y20]WOQ70515.1 lysophospholipid acyltransferase family protein [Microbacterium sp. Y20]
MSARPRASREKTRPSIFWVLAGIVVPVVGLLARIEIVGGEKLPRKGAYVLAPNHYSEIDPLIVAVAVWRLGRAPRFMAKESLFRVPVLGWALRATGMVPVARASTASGAAQTIEASRRLVDDGRGVIVYPEGTLTRDPDLWPMRGKTGAARLALAGGLPVIPVAHWGAQQIMGRYSKKIDLWPPRKHVRLVIGDPVDLSDLRATGSQPATLTRATTRIMDAITALLASLRQETPPAERWNPAEHAQKETGRFES